MANLIATNLTCPHSECLEVWLQLCFQNIFFLEMHQNNIFFIFKKLFLTSVYQNYLKTLKKY